MIKDGLDQAQYLMLPIEELVYIDTFQVTVIADLDSWLLASHYDPQLDCRQPLQTFLLAHRSGLQNTVQIYPDTRPITHLAKVPFGIK
jgi:hypothetical protein